MKKVLGLGTLVLAGLMTFTGCNSNKDDDKKSETTNEILGNYEFEYMSFGTAGTAYFYTCPVEDLEFNSDGGLSQTIECKSYKATTYQIKEDKMIVEDDDTKETTYIRFNEKGELLLGANEDFEKADSPEDVYAWVHQEYYEFKNGRMYISRTYINDIEVVYSYKKK